MYFLFLGKKLLANFVASQYYEKDFKNLIKSRNLTKAQVFNLDESNLPYKHIPAKILAPTKFSSVSGMKEQMEKFSFGACSNADGSLKLPLIVIGKSKNPQCFENINKKNLPIWYNHQESAFMNEIIFEEWFRNEFVPKVEKFLVSISLPPLAVLLVDNCSAHIHLKVRNIEVRFFPSNVTSQIQPMDQGIIQTIKLKYQLLLVNSVLEAECKNITLIEHLKSIEMLHAIDWIAKAWGDVKESTIRKCWRKLFAVKMQDAATQTEEEQSDLILDLSFSVESEAVDTPSSNHTCPQDVNNLLTIIKKMDGYQETDEQTILNWLEVTRKQLGKFCSSSNI